MYYKIKKIFKASVCSFCENIYEYASIDEREFVQYLIDFLSEENLQDFLEQITKDICYDITNIDNICRDKLFPLKNKKFNDIEEIIKYCTVAYLKTLEKDKTINIEAFVDNLADEFLKIKI